MKKFLVILLVLTMVAPTALAAEKLEGFYTPPTMNEGQYPIAQEGVKLTYWMPINAGASNFITSYDENPSYIKVQEDTGVDIEFIHPPAGTATENFKTMLMSGELPDLIQVQAETWYSGGLKALFEDGAIIDISPYLDEFAPQYKEVINNSDVAQRQMIGDDGEVLGFYKITYADAMPFVRINLNKTWLDEFAMTEPVTIEQYEAYFQAVLDNKPGIVPFHIDAASAGQMALILGPYDLLQGFYLDKDGKSVNHYANQAAYKEALTLLNRWYEKVI